MAMTRAAPGPEGWWSTFFAEEHARFQMALSEGAHDSDAETALLMRLASISKDSRVLDVPCGQGRHAIRLAQKGATVTGVDSSSAMLQRAERDALDRGTHVCWVQTDMRAISWTSEFDCVICLGGSFGYFGRHGDEAFLKTLRCVLKPGGRLVVDVPSLEFVISHHQPLHESLVGGRRVVQHRHLDTASGVAGVSVVIETDRGPVSRTYYQQLYRLGELRTMLAAARFTVREILQASDVAEFQSHRGHLLVLAH